MFRVPLQAPGPTLQARDDMLPASSASELISREPFVRSISSASLPTESVTTRQAPGATAVDMVPTLRSDRFPIFSAGMTENDALPHASARAKDGQNLVLESQVRCLLGCRTKKYLATMGNDQCKVGC
jgi:hypothetical protein